MAKKNAPVDEQVSQPEVSQPEVSQPEASQPEASQPEVQVSKLKVGERARQLLLEGTLDNKGILEQIKKEYPDAKTSIACIAWYKSDLKKKAPVDGFKQWLKDNEAKLRAEYEAQQAKA